MDSKELKNLKNDVLFPDELDIINVVGERFHAENWYKLIINRIKEKRSDEKSLLKRY